MLLLRSKYIIISVCYKRFKKDLLKQLELKRITIRI